MEYKMTQNKTINEKIEELRRLVKIEKEKISLFDYWFENKSEELYGTEEGHKIESAWMCNNLDILQAKLSTLQEAKDEIEEAQRECGKAINEAIINRRKLDIEEFLKMIENRIKYYKNEGIKQREITKGYEGLSSKEEGALEELQELKSKIRGEDG